VVVVREGEAVTEPVLGWWFAKGDTLPHGDGRKVAIGETLTVEGPIVLCERGLHASRRLVDALKYAPGPILYRVRLSGTIVPHSSLRAGEDKLAASERTALWRVDATRALRLFACDVAESALLRERKAGREPDNRSWEAIRVTRLWLDGKATEAARSAARSAAESAARNAAWNAAESAAWSAAWNAAWNAAESAARSAAESAASRAASHAAWSAAERMFQKRIREARKAQP